MQTRSRLAAAAFFAAATLGATQASAGVELISNGDFSAGLTGWTVTNAGSGDILADTVGTTTPISGITTSAAGGGAGLYAVSDQTGPGTHALTQAFTVSAGAAGVVITFDLFANDSDGGPFDTGLLDHTGAPNQHVRVDILTASAGAFSTAAADIVTTLIFPFVDPQASNPNPFTNYMFDITSAVGGGGTFQLRFAEVDNQLFLNMGVDNVSIQETVPEPFSAALVGLGMAAFAASRRRRASV